MLWIWGLGRIRRVRIRMVRKGRCGVVSMGYVWIYIVFFFFFFFLDGQTL